MKRLLLILFILLFSSSARGTEFVNENWDTGTPAACWPCKTIACSDQFHSWDSLGPDELGGSGTVPNSGLSTDRAHSGTRSYKMTKQLNTTDSCGIQMNFTNASTIHFRFYAYFTSDFVNWQVGGRQNSHWIFMVETAYSCTGFRLDLLGSSGEVWGSCPTGEVCMSPSGHGCSSWGDEYTRRCDCDDHHWSPAPNMEDYMEKWTSFEYKLEILDNSTCTANSFDANCVRMTEWIDGVQTRGPCIGVGHNSSTWSWIIFTFYEHAASNNERVWYLDDIVIADSYIGPMGGGDTTPPVISYPLPSGVQGCSSHPQTVTLQVTTNESATCKYHTSDAPYDFMPYTFSNTTGTTSHTNPMSLGCAQSYSFYVRCMDTSNNKNTSSTQISFDIRRGHGWHVQ